MIPSKFLFWYESRLLDNYDKTLDFLKKKNMCVLDAISERKLEYAFERALSSPAYTNFLKKNKLIPKKLSARKIKDIVPLTDKRNYIKKYSPEKRCIKGKFPCAGNIDESAGSSGIPTNWIRSYSEESMLLKSIYFEYKYMFDSKNPTIVLSAWSSGPWATGIKFCELVEHFALVKNTTTDMKDIMQTIKKFGSNYHYIIAGYPIFLENLFEQKFPWKNYSIDIVTGGDGCSVSWPKKIRGKLKNGANIVSSYGCSDIDIGIGFETPFAQQIRVESSRNKSLAKALFGDLEVIPMLFQYNPSMHFIQNLPNNEFAVTHLDFNVASPKIKYNIHDIGQAIKFNDVMNALNKHSKSLFNKYKSGKYKNPVLHLPFIYIAGRSDGTISLDGGNIFPEQIDIILKQQFCKETDNFKLKRDEKKKNPFRILIELKNGVKKSNNLKKKIEGVIGTSLPNLNTDYKESLKNNKDLKPVVELFGKGMGPFDLDDHEIKYNYIEKN